MIQKVTAPRIPVSWLVLVLLGVSIFATACGGGTTNVPGTATPRPTLTLASTAAPSPTQNSDTPTKTSATRSSALATRTATKRASATRPPTKRAVTPTRPARINGFRTIAFNDLVPEARATLQLIERGGPFPYRQDGQIFQNREGILPKHPSGYYHEYTVDTPGSADRGARRIIAGAQGELYYTDDHYNSFKVIVTP